MITAKLFGNAFTMRPRKEKKNRIRKQWNAASKLWGVWLLSYNIWSMINMLSNDTYLKFLQSCFTEQHYFQNWMSKCRQGNCYNRSPMWPSLGFKPFGTKKQHGFVYMIFLDKNLNNSQSFSSCVPSHHHWHKSTVALLNIVWFWARCSQMLTEMCGWAGDNFVHWMFQVQQENVIKVPTCWPEWPFLSQIQVQQLTNPRHVLIMQCW